ncbi:MAG: hypothetical protein JSV03_17305 [Planctomycetota bacterium]|nr:MAG: hypothetical protein JSV03_17305 [Planctomycetota bacterium]
MQVLQTEPLSGLLSRKICGLKAAFISAVKSGDFVTSAVGVYNIIKKMITEPQDQTGGEQLSLENLPVVAYVEIDRYCDGCGYNLRTQAVCRDPRTSILVCRCPECARFHAATDTVTSARPWLHRLATLLLLIWIVVVISGAGSIVLLEFISTAVSFEELTRWRRLPASVINAPGYAGPRYKYELRPMDRENKVFVAVLISSSFVLGFTGAVFATVIFCHWRRRYYFIVVLTIPVLIGISAYYIWKINAPSLMQWCIPYIFAHTIAQILGGVIGVVSGRPFARLLIRILIPPPLRSYLAFLWLVDGKQVPGVATNSTR